MKATCTWGDGPDVLVELDGSIIQLYETPGRFDWAVHGTAGQGSICLTAKEAYAFAADLVIAAAHAESLERSLKETEGPNEH